MTRIPYRAEVLLEDEAREEVSQEVQCRPQCPPTPDCSVGRLWGGPAGWVMLPGGVWPPAAAAGVDISGTALPVLGVGLGFVRNQERGDVAAAQHP